MLRTRSAVGLILRQNSGDYRGAGQRLVKLPKYFFFALRGFQQGFAGQTVKVCYSVQIRTNSKSWLFHTNKDEQ